MAKCNWDPSKHEGRPCPIHGSGMWDENILTRKDKIEKLKSKGYTQEEIEEELKSESFDEDDEKDLEFEEKEEVKEEFDKGEDWSEEKISEEVADDEYVYADIDDKNKFIELLVERNGVPKDKAKEWVDKFFEEHLKYYGKSDEEVETPKSI